MATGAYGYATNAPDLMWEGGLGAAFSFVPLVQSVRAATKPVTVASSHFTRSLDDMMLRPAVNSNVPMQPTANLNRMSVPHSLVEASEVNGIQGLAQHLSGGSGAAGIKQTTMSSAIPTKDSIIMYGHVKDSTGQLIEAAIGIKGKTSGILSLTKPTKGLIEGANEASAAYKRVRAGMASPTSVASGGVNTPAVQAKLPKALKGEYNDVKGHHVHAKKAFEGHVNYDPKKGFSISDNFMKSRGVEHSDITGIQHTKFNELAKSGRPNTIEEHTRIAVESLTEVGINLAEARSLVAESLSSLRAMGVRVPTRLPWN